MSTKTSQLHFEHLTPETAALLDASDGRKISYINSDVFVGWPLANQTIDAIQWRFDMESGTRRRCLAIIADSGMGKSWLWRVSAPAKSSGCLTHKAHAVADLELTGRFQGL